MKKKFILRIFLITLFFSSLLFIFFKYNNKEEQIEKKMLITEQEEPIETEEKFIGSNIIENVSYSAKDNKGNEYILKASEGVIDQKENNYIFLTAVKASINLKDYNLIEISSNFGKYNINNYDTIFSKNVLITYLDNKIKGEYLDFSWEKNLLIISRDVFLENDKSSLKADVIEVNIEKKDIKIFMYDENKKVKINAID
tara:strand:+ start:510 stop:1106 length:597 start_codon:yes stop_codon:yes gene_type:complete